MIFVYFFILGFYFLKLAAGYTLYSRAYCTVQYINIRNNILTVFTKLILCTTNFYNYGNKNIYGFSKIAN